MTRRVVADTAVVTSRRLPSGLGYIRLTLWKSPIRKQFKKALDREYVEAGLELSEPPQISEKPGPPLDASVLISEAELKAATGYEGKFTVEKLADLPQSHTYDSRHFRAVDKPESFDAALRAWKLPTAAAAEARYAAIRRET